MITSYHTETQLMILVLVLLEVMRGDLVLLMTPSTQTVHNDVDRNKSIMINAFKYNKKFRKVPKV